MPTDDYSDFGDIKDHVLDYLKDNGGAGSEIVSQEVNGRSISDVVLKADTDSDIGNLKTAGPYIGTPELYYLDNNGIRLLAIRGLYGKRDMFSATTLEWHVVYNSGESETYKLPYNPDPTAFFNYSPISAIKVRIIFNHELKSDWSNVLNIDARIAQVGGSGYTFIGVTKYIYGISVRAMSPSGPIGFPVTNRAVLLIKDGVVFKKYPLSSYYTHIPFEDLDNLTYDIVITGNVYGVPIYYGVRSIEPPYIYGWVSTTVLSNSYANISAYIDSAYTNNDDLNDYLVTTGKYAPITKSYGSTIIPYLFDDNDKVTMGDKELTIPSGSLNHKVQDGSLLLYNNNDIKVYEINTSGSSITATLNNTIPIGLSYSTAIRKSANTFIHVGGIDNSTGNIVNKVYDTDGTVITTLVHKAIYIGAVNIPNVGTLLIGGEDDTQKYRTVQLYPSSGAGEIIVLPTKLPFGISRISAVLLSRGMIMLCGDVSSIGDTYVYSDRHVAYGPQVLMLFNYDTGWYKLLTPPVHNLRSSILIKDATYDKVYMVGGYDSSMHVDYGVHEVVV